jgi:hypothetical protein
MAATIAALPEPKLNTEAAPSVQAAHTEFETGAVSSTAKPKKPPTGRTPPALCVERSTVFMIQLRPPAPLGWELSD